jgi:hypothetical protein
LTPLGRSWKTWRTLTWPCWWRAESHCSEFYFLISYSYFLIWTYDTCISIFTGIFWGLYLKCIPLIRNFLCFYKLFGCTNKLKETSLKVRLQSLGDTAIIPPENGYIFMVKNHNIFSPLSSAMVGQARRK